MTTKNKLKQVPLLVLFYALLPQGSLFAKDSINSNNISFSHIFYKVDKHLVNSFLFQYGANHVIACIGTYSMVHSGIDWDIHQLAYHHDIVAYAGFPSVIIGGLVPVAVPLGMYFYGKSHQRPKLQYVALAMGQAAILSLTISSSIKAFTGRRPPGILRDDIAGHDFSSDFKFGFLNRGAFDGWPSGHTMTAFAMATTLIQFYPENKILKIGALTYASFIGLGVSLNIHWFSDAFAGALMGYAIGKTVGSGFLKLMDNNTKAASFDFQLMPDGAKLSFRF